MEDWEKDIIHHNLQKAINCEVGFNLLVEDIIEKAKAGTYGNTLENRRLGRVGQKYGEKKELIIDKALDKFVTALKRNMIIRFN